jgi:hypothetical protein
VVLDVGEPVYTYERVEIVVDGDGLAYEDEDVQQSEMPLSEHVDCLGWDGYASRSCRLESYVLDTGPIPTERYTHNPNQTDIFSFPQSYVQIDGKLYLRVHEVNTSVTDDDGSYRVDIDLMPVDPRFACESMADDIEYEDVSPVIAEAVREGQATTKKDVPVLSTPVVADGGDCYSVYRSETAEPPYESGFPLVVWLGPFGGIALFGWLWSRAEISFDL